MNKTEQKDDYGTHMTHCNQGEYVGFCKYSESDCPTNISEEQREIYRKFEKESKTEQQESVENKIDNMIAQCCMFHADCKEDCLKPCLALKSWGYQFDKLYKEKYLGGLPGKIEEVKYKISPIEEKIQNANYFVKWRANQKLDKVLSIIQEEKEEKK